MTNDIRQISDGYPTPTLSSGRPVGWLPDVQTLGTAGTFRIEVGATWSAPGPGTPTITAAGTTVNTYLGTPTIIDSLSFGEPHGELTGQLTFSGVTPFSMPAWLTPGANVDIWLTQGTAEHPYWHGFIASLELADSTGVSASVSAQLTGALFGEASLRAHQPVILDSSVDIGTSLGRALYPQDYSRPLNPYRFYFESATSGIETRHRGSRGQMVIDYADEMLGLAQNGTAQWTISRAYSGSWPQARKYYFRPVGTYGSAIQTNTVTTGGYGVALSMTQDLSQSENAIYGEGLAEDGSRWRNAKYPQLFPGTAAYPDRISGSDYPLTFGDSDGLFVQDSITQMQYALRAGGWPSVTITGTWDADTTTAIEALFLDATGAFQSTVTSNADWDLIFETSTGTTDISSALFRPLSVVAESEYYDFAPNGAVRGTASAYDGRLRVERVISYGENIDMSRARIHARALATQAIYGPPWSGTITLNGVDPEERSRLLIREGSWVTLNEFGGTAVPLYVAGVTHGDEGMTTTLTVSETAWSLLDLTTRLERNREAKTDPAKSFYALRNRPNRPMREVTGWDKEAGAGIIQPTTLTANTWNVIKFIGGQRGSIGAMSARTSGTACAYALAMFGGSVSAAAIGSVVSNPLGSVTGGYDSHWVVPAATATLEAMAFIDAWGSYGEAAGYYPGAQSIGTALSAGTVTGKMLDSLAWDFVSTDPPFLWAAVYPLSNCTFRAEARILIEE